MAGKGGGAWKVAYADFVTAMMAFFMVMWLLSQSDDVKDAVAEHFRNPTGRYAVGDSLLPPKRPQFFKERRPALIVGESPFPPNPEKEKTRRPHTLALNHGDRAHLGTALFFDEQSDALDQSSEEKLRAFVPFVLGKPQKIEIRGHATPRSTTTSLDSDAWQLSYQRCVAAMKFLEQLGVPRQRMRLSQAGDSEPYTIGDDPERLARNSRVEVFLLNEVAEDAVGTSEERERRYATP
jgi:chemotaxis protein MotB